MPGDGGGVGLGLELGGRVDRPGVGDVPPRGEEPDGPEAEADGEPDTVMVRPMCGPLPLPLRDRDDGGTGVDPLFCGTWLVSDGPMVAAAAVGAPL